MYGIVNKVIEELVVSLVGNAGWHKVCEIAKLEPFTFITLERYDDDLTHKLVNACAEVLGISAHEVLVHFGRHWSVYTGKQGYAHMFKMLGDDLFTFLHNLPQLHDHVAMIFPQMLMPQFQSTQDGERRMEVIYRSSRHGFASMVQGLLEGMADVYHQPAVVTQIQSTAKGGALDVFEVVLQ
jgi:hypothetical protein